MFFREFCLILLICLFCTENGNFFNGTFEGIVFDDGMFNGMFDNVFDDIVFNSIFDDNIFDGAFDGTFDDIVFDNCNWFRFLGLAEGFDGAP